MSAEKKAERIAEGQWKWHGKAAHFICGEYCRFHLATEIGDYIVSTVGEYFPAEGVREIHARTKGVVLEGRGDVREYDYLQKCGYDEIGYGRKYETMAFKTDGQCACGCGLPKILPNEVLFNGYNDAPAATEGHLEICRQIANGDVGAEGK